MRPGKENRGFSLVEVIAAAVLLGVGIAAAIGALGQMTQADIRVNQIEIMSRLAESKLDELVATEQATTTTDGNFEDIGEQRYQWRLEVEPTGVENLDAVSIIVETIENRDSDPSVEFDTLVYRPPAAADGATP